MQPNSILPLFKGLNKAQAKALTDRIYPTLEKVRAEITNPSPDGNNPQGAKNMTDQQNEATADNFYNTLTDEEQAKLSAGISHARQQIETERKQKGLDVLRQQYQGELNAIAQKGLMLSDRIRDISDLKAKYRAKGLEIY